jgi:hypothetical protein
MSSKPSQLVPLTPQEGWLCDGRHEGELQLLPQEPECDVLPQGLQQRRSAGRQGLHLGRRDREPLVARLIATPGVQALGVAEDHFQQGVSARSGKG